MKRLAIGAVLATTAISLSACGGGAVENEAPKPVQQTPTITSEYVEMQVAYGSVEKVVIDGYTCFVYDGSSSGGIWCDAGTVQ